MPPWWRQAQPPPQRFDPLRGQSAGAIPLTLQQAKALRCCLDGKPLQTLFERTNEGLAQEYKLDIWLRQKALIDPYNVLTIKGRASLDLFENPPRPKPQWDEPPRYRYEPRRSQWMPLDDPDEDDDDEEEEPTRTPDGRTDQNIRVLVNNQQLTIHVLEVTENTWVAETHVPSLRGKRRSHLELTRANKADAIHAVLAEASAMLARAHVRLNS